MADGFTRRFLLAGAAGGAAIASSGAQAFAQTMAAAEEPLLGPAQGVALLSRNENPFGPSPAARRAIADAGLKGAYYAGRATMVLMDMIAEKNGLSRENITLSAGSGEVLSALAWAYASKGDTLGADLYWDTTAKFASNKGLNDIKRVPLKADMSVDLAAMEAAVDDSIGLVQICNPNNPTSVMADAGELREFTKRVSKKATVLIDEAYIEITDDPEGNSMVDLINEGYDVIVARTFSKIYGMAGIRMGYAMAAPETIEKLRSHTMSWTSGPALAASIASYNDEAFLEFSKSKLIEGRQMVMETAKGLGLNVLPSQTSFCYVDVGMDADIVQKAMASKNIMIRGKYSEKYKNWSRVSMGFIADVERYCNALPEAVQA